MTMWKLYPYQSKLLNKIHANSLYGTLASSKNSGKSIFAEMHMSPRVITISKHFGIDVFSKNNRNENLRRFSGENLNYKKVGDADIVLSWDEKLGKYKVLKNRYHHNGITFKDINEALDYFNEMESIYGKV